MQRASFSSVHTNCHEYDSLHCECNVRVILLSVAVLFFQFGSVYSLLNCISYYTELYSGHYELPRVCFASLRMASMVFFSIAILLLLIATSFFLVITNCHECVSPHYELPKLAESFPPLIKAINMFLFTVSVFLFITNCCESLSCFGCLFLYCNCHGCILSESRQGS